MRRVLYFVAFVSTIFLLGAVSSSPAHAMPAEANNYQMIRTHVVQPGEHIYCIARAYRVDPWAITAANGIVNPNLIYPGMVLTIPNAPAWLPAGPVCVAQYPTGVCTCVTYHVVQPGENLFRISLAYGVPMWKLAQCNGMLNWNYVQAYQPLCIPAQ